MYKELIQLNIKKKKNNSVEDDQQEYEEILSVTHYSVQFSSATQSCLIL